MGKIIDADFISDNGIKYSLYEGKSIDGSATSDICFIMLDDYSKIDDELFDGDKEYELVGWFYGAFQYEDFINDFKNIVEGFVKKYEEKHTDIVNYLTKGIKEKEEDMNSDTIYVNTANKYDKVTIMDILKRYIDINGTTVGFEAYVKNDFRDDSGEVEYVKEKKRYKVTIECSSHATVEVEASSEEEAKEIAECSGDRYEFIEGTECEKIIEVEEV